ncbi:hypothetical protein ACP275_11G043700 [Erythranthe tilingii]
MNGNPLTAASSMNEDPLTAAEAEAPQQSTRSATVQPPTRANPQMNRGLSTTPPRTIQFLPRPVSNQVLVGGRVPNLGIRPAFPNCPPHNVYGLRNLPNYPRHIQPLMEGGYLLVPWGLILTPIGIVISPNVDLASLSLDMPVNITWRPPRPRHVYVIFIHPNQPPLNTDLGLGPSENPPLMYTRPLECPLFERLPNEAPDSLYAVHGDPAALPRVQRLQGEEETYLFLLHGYDLRMYQEMIPENGMQH